MRGVRVQLCKTEAMWKTWIVGRMLMDVDFPSLPLHPPPSSLPLWALTRKEQDSSLKIDALRCPDPSIRILYQGPALSGSGHLQYLFPLLCC
ncbi:hypothetical protein TNIN_34071 [Trichonephila inaurata madagascariensis]|uniref:Uncharacterized protein n=1 Tax=Trichonephila inaurata madagascariensis TaxID=2747483 RepID=A0A8X6X4A1_9ARAC|nr:hypothetical protein TNIN_34071 [Trichonephila inaurata madagascariensis]